MATSIATAYGCKLSIKWSDIAYIPTVNSPEMVDQLERVAHRLVGKSGFGRMAEPSMAAEDFSFLAGAGSLDPAVTVPVFSQA